jgi:hypothetical protein
MPLVLILSQINLILTLPPYFIRILILSFHHFLFLPITFFPTSYPPSVVLTKSYLLTVAYTEWPRSNCALLRRIADGFAAEYRCNTKRRYQ